MADIDGPMSALKYGAGKAGQVLGGTALPVIAGVGAGLVGGPAAGAAAAAAVGYPLAVQQTAADLAAQGVPNDTIASITGIPIAALDTLGLGAAGALGGRAASKLVGGVVGDALAARLGSSVAGRAVRGAAAEAPTEFTQQAVQEAAGRVAGGDRPLSEMLGNSLEAGALGAVGGGILGPIFHHGRHVENPAAETPPADAAPAEPAPLALPAPDHADPIIQPLVAEHNDLRVRAQELQAKVAANPGATPDAIRLQNVQARMGQIAQQIQQVRQSAITPAAAPVDSAIPTQIAPAGISRPVEPTPDWTQAQPGEVAIPIEENGQQIGGHVFLRDDGTARIPGVAPNVGLPSPLSQLPDRVPTPAEVLEAANVPQGPKVVSGAVVDAQLTGAIDTARQKRQQERIDRQKAIQEQAQKDAADLQRWTEQVRVARQAAPDDAGSLLQFVRSHGGINRNAEGGQDVIATMARSYSGQDGRRLRGVTVGTGGNTVEDMAMRAWQAGYVGGEERPTIQDFLDALEKDGRKGGVYPEAEQDRRAVLEAQQVGARGAMDAAGVLVTDTPKQAARKLVAWERAQAETPETALPEATNENVEPPPARAAIGADDDIPFRKQELPPLADDEVEMPRSTATAAQRAEAETRVRRIAREMFGPQVNVAASDSIGTNRGEFAHGMYEAPEPGSAAGVIHVAMRAANTPISDRDQLRTVYHEGIHHLRHMKAFKPAEWKVLADKAAKEWKAKHKIEELYPDASPDLKTEEAIAEAFADWRAGQDQGPKVNGIFARIQRLFSRVAQAARGLGFKTADDIFSDVSKGRTAKRIRPDVAQEESPERKFSLKPPPNSIPTPEENVQRGKAALDEAYRTGQDSYNAMYRKDLLGGNDGDTGWIDFLNGDRKLGLEHMFEGRENNPKDDPPLVGKDFTKFINNIPDTIQNGQLHGWYEERGDIRRNITRNNQTVVLQFNHDNGRSTWIATVRPGYTKKALNGRFISPAEAQRLINKAIGKDTAGASGRVTGSVSGATRGANQTSPTSNTPREAGTANRPGRSPISGAAGAAVRENVPNKVQPVKPKTGPYRLRPATAPAPTPTTIREALNEGE
ncbi:MAG TPA: hypothetical protein VN838_20825, partial [Bradyrhizobium sp.]|nr:hypothetical protein [Bradyrhizobium sp.]